jgi:predicted DNA-binding protein
MKTETIIFRISKESKKELKAIAKEDGRTLSNFIYSIINREIKKRTQDFLGDSSSTEHKYHVKTKQKS